MKTTIYVDALNLYHGCLKGTPYKWLDLKGLFESLLIYDNEITNIRYFTARIKARHNNPSAPQRQQTYIRALKKYNPEIVVHYGHFLENETFMTTANPPHDRIKVFKSEEKGSDVNLATNLLNDAWLNNFECGIIVSNDSDMVGAMKLIREYHPEKKLGLISPILRGNASPQLKQEAHFVKKMRENALINNQLPDVIPYTNIKKPKEWY